MASIVRRLPSANFTRPADTTAYASGDLVANSTTVGSVVPMTFSPCTKGAGRSGQIRRVRISKTGTSITNTTVRVHLFSVLPTVSTNGDNGAITIATGAAGYLGQVDVVINQAFTDGAAGQLVTEINFNALTLYGLLEARGAWTPASAEVITVTLESAED
jgi:hypothetical protein